MFYAYIYQMTNLLIHEIVIIYMYNFQSWLQYMAFVSNYDLATIVICWNKNVNMVTALWVLKALKFAITITQLMNFLSKLCDKDTCFIAWLPSMAGIVAWPIIYKFWEWLHGRLLGWGISKALWGLLYYCVQSLARDNGYVKWQTATTKEWLGKMIKSHGNISAQLGIHTEKKNNQVDHMAEGQLYEALIFFVTQIKYQLIK